MCFRAPVLLLFAAAAAMQGQEPRDGWRPLFDGKSLDGWRESEFPGRGQARAAGGVLVLGYGEPMTGVTWTREFPKSNYEIQFEASRTAGADFFASLTFPYRDSFATFVTGGWGGDIVGLSSIDGWDASDNETRSYFNFENGRWYTFRLQVRDDRIMGWIDEKPVFHVVVAGRSISLRPGDIKHSAPLGFASYRSTGSIRNIRYRMLQ